MAPLDCNIMNFSMLGGFIVGGIIGHYAIIAFYVWQTLHE